jgi:hypothetical protein
VTRFLVDYAQRHRHPVNAVLHAVGVPMTGVGVWQALAGRPLVGAALLGAGFLLQYLGHAVQGNEMGEVMLARRLWRAARGAQVCALPLGFVLGLAPAASGASVRGAAAAGTGGGEQCSAVDCANSNRVLGISFTVRLGSGVGWTRGPWR